VTGDGKRFLMVRYDRDRGPLMEEATELQVVLNWDQELLERVAVK
jgi:hypothetical protein